MSDSGFEIEGWDEFVERFSRYVDKWEAKKAQLLMKMGNIYQSAVVPHVPVDTSRLVDSITIFGEGIPHDFVEVGTNVEYALYVNDGHVQHKRFLPADKLSVGGKAKYLKNRNQKGIMLSEKYIPGTFFLEKGMQDAKPRLNRLVESFMEQTAREAVGAGAKGGSSSSGSHGSSVDYVKVLKESYKKGEKAINKAEKDTKDW